MRLKSLLRWLLNIHMLFTYENIYRPIPLVKYGRVLEVLNQFLWIPKIGQT